MVANTTYGFLAACMAAIFVPAAFAFAGFPLYGIASLGIIFGAFFVYFFGTWHNVPKNPDISVTGEAQYVAALAQRLMAAKNAEIVRDQTPMIGGIVAGSGAADEP